MVDAGRFGAPVHAVRTAFMRYVGQGHEIPVRLSDRAIEAADASAIRASFDAEYARFYDRPVPGSDVEVMSFAVSVATETLVQDEPAPPTRPAGPPRQSLRDPGGGCATRRERRGGGSWPVHPGRPRGPRLPPGSMERESAWPGHHRGGRDLHPGRRAVDRRTSTIPPTASSS